MVPPLCFGCYASSIPVFRAFSVMLSQFCPGGRREADKKPQRPWAAPERAAFFRKPDGRAALWVRSIWIRGGATQNASAGAGRGGWTGAAPQGDGHSGRLAGGRIKVGLCRFAAGIWARMGQAAARFIDAAAWGCAACAAHSPGPRWRHNTPGCGRKTSGGRRPPRPAGQPRSAPQSFPCGCSSCCGG